MVPQEAHEGSAIGGIVLDSAPVTPLICFGALCNQITKIGFEEIVFDLDHFRALFEARDILRLTISTTSIVGIISFAPIRLAIGRAATDVRSLQTPLMRKLTQRAASLKPRPPYRARAVWSPRERQSVLVCCIVYQFNGSLIPLEQRFTIAALAQKRSAEQPPQYPTRRRRSTFGSLMRYSKAISARTRFPASLKWPEQT